MGARCWTCGDKIGRCYECGTSDCGHIGCRCTPAATQPTDTNQAAVSAADESEA